MQARVFVIIVYYTHADYTIQKWPGNSVFTTWKPTYAMIRWCPGL